MVVLVIVLVLALVPVPVVLVPELALPCALIFVLISPRGRRQTARRAY